MSNAPSVLASAWPFAFDGVFENEFPIELAGAMFEQFLKRRADGGFVFDAVLFKFGEVVVITADNFV